MNKKASNIDFSKNFDKQLKKSPIKIKIAFRNRLELFLENSFHGLLKNHVLTGSYEGFRSINVTGDWRAIFYEIVEDETKTIIFIALGTHSQLYKNN